MHILELERVLTKLKFDQDVSGYALLTNDGQPFLSFGLPDDIVPQLRGTLAIHAESLTLVNVLTGQGTVVLARADASWVLAVLFVPELNLGSALQRTKDVVELFDRVELPPPPSLIGATVESATTEVDVKTPETTESTEEHIPLEVTSIQDLVIRHGCIIIRGPHYDIITHTDSSLYNELRESFDNLGTDILMMVDEKRTAFKIAESLAKTVDRVVEVLQWCYDRGLVDAECPEEQESAKKEIVEMPFYEADLKKAKKEHRAILELCDGTRTVHDIAEELDMLYFKVLQSIIPYKGKKLKMIRKTKE